MALREAGRAALAKAVENKKPFKHGNLSGDTDIWRFGRIPYEMRDLVKNADYVIFSYSTPIAFYKDGMWFVPPIRYSVTTTNHQNVLRVLIGV